MPTSNNRPVEVSRSAIRIAAPLSALTEMLALMDRLWSIPHPTNKTSKYRKVVKGPEMLWIFNHEMPTFRSTNAAIVGVCTTLTITGGDQETIVTAITTLAPVPNGAFDKAANSGGDKSHLAVVKSVCEDLFKLQVSAIEDLDGPGQAVA